MDAELSNIKSIIKKASRDTHSNGLKWTIYLPDNEHITFVAKRNVRKKKKQVVIYEVLKHRTENGTYVIFYDDVNGVYVPYSMFRKLELDILDINPSIIKRKYEIHKRTTNSLSDIANLPQQREKTQHLKEKLQKKNEENVSIILLGGITFSNLLIKDTNDGELKWSVYKAASDVVYYLDKKTKYGSKFAISKMKRKDAIEWNVNIDGNASCEKLNWEAVEESILQSKPQEVNDTTVVMSMLALTVLNEWIKRQPQKQNLAQTSKSTIKINENGIASIGVKDFLIRRNVFKCMHKNHNLKNIDAEIVVTSRIGKDRVISFTAGHCSDCNLYYIMESTYEHLKRFGIPNCRISDEKSYMKAISTNEMMLAQESILMQYGYTVSKEFDLTEITRHKILANLIDNHIMTKNEIISYLDFFISQHTSSIYEMAVAKWELDRDFVREYNVGRYTKYGVGGIRR